ncbi:MAG: hypothetical protein IKW92_09790 [Firmicutes bacterium]|nr:hypothetical protein [Bacillota bacterium]
MEQMKRTARGLDVVFKILAILAIVGIAILAVINIAGFAVGYDKLYEPKAVSFSISTQGYHIDAKDLGTPQQIGSFILMLSLSAAVSLAAVWYGIRIIRHILAPMKEGQPFREGVGRDFRKLGWFVIAYGIVYNIFDLFIKNLLAFRLLPIAGDGPVTVGIEHRLDLTFLIIAFILFLCSYIFRYGEELQQLSDETV